MCLCGLLVSPLYTVNVREDCQAAVLIIRVVTVAATEALEKCCVCSSWQHPALMEIFFGNVSSISDRNLNNSIKNGKRFNSFEVSSLKGILVL